MKYLIAMVLTIISIVTLLTAPGQTEEDPFANLDCKATNTQLEMNRCAYLSLQAADQELNQV